MVRQAANTVYFWTSRQTSFEAGFDATPRILAATCPAIIRISAEGRDDLQEYAFPYLCVADRRLQRRRSENRAFCRCMSRGRIQRPDRPSRSRSHNIRRSKVAVATGHGCRWGCCAPNLTNKKVPAERSPAGTSLLECSYKPPRRRQKLLQRTVDRSEFVIEVRSEAVNHSDNGQRDAGCNQTIFNCGSARFIGQKIQQNTLQFSLLGFTGW